MSADGRLAASAGDDGIVRVWSFDELRTRGQLLSALDGRAGTIWSLALSADRRRIASGGVDNTVRLWDSGTVWRR